MNERWESAQIVNSDARELQPIVCRLRFLVRDGDQWSGSIMAGLRMWEVSVMGLWSNKLSWCMGTTIKISVNISHWILYKYPVLSLFVQMILMFFEYKFRSCLPCNKCTDSIKKVVAKAFYIKLKFGWKGIDENLELNLTIVCKKKRSWMKRDGTPTRKKGCLIDSGSVQLHCWPFAAFFRYTIVEMPEKIS